MNFNDFAIVSFRGSDSRIDFCYISKNDAINIMKNSNLNEKSGSSWFLPYIEKWVKNLMIKETEMLY